MWNLFKTKTEIKKIKEVKTDKKEVQVINSKIIQEDINKSFNEILKEFDLYKSKESTIEDLTLELESFRESNKTIYDKIEKLNQFGFTNTPSSNKLKDELASKELEINTKIESIQIDIDSKKELENLIADYNIKYPGFKFIDKETMVSIMEKYQLILGDTSLYCKEIPDKALGLISSFSKHILNNNKCIYKVYSRSIMLSRYASLKIGNYTPKSDRYSYNDEVKTITTSNLKMIAPNSHFKIPTLEFENKEFPIYKLNKNRELELTVDEYNKAIQKANEVLDPIAVLEVKRGYIIIDAWDEEANIPEIQNGLLN